EFEASCLALCVVTAASVTAALVLDVAGRGCRVLVVVRAGEVVLAGPRRLLLMGADLTGFPCSLIVLSTQSPSDWAVGARVVRADLFLPGHRVTPDRVRA
ncbi:hypothetical protein, partial [Burkholderia sp. SIMBA_024]|uniref:hypothetical protein n=1 Tax=Burkholderia sp. SIMBA_024 TaxID=3085768 RepID=UPI00397DA1B1